MSRRNYTAKEKTDLLTIVEKYKGVLENKGTNQVTIEKKKHAWEQVANEFNASADTPRTGKQLSIAYKNFKRMFRKEVADENMQNYIEKKKVIAQFKKESSLDKKAIMGTGGGSFQRPLLSDMGSQMLAIMGDQVKPLSNNCDSAHEYYGLNDESKNDDIDDDKNLVVIEIINDEDLDSNRAMEVDNDLSPSPEEVQKNRPQARTVIQSAPGRKRNLAAVNRKKNNDSETLKRIYYKKKIECAIIEKKTNLVKYRAAVTNLKILELDKKLKQLEYNAKIK